MVDEHEHAKAGDLVRLKIDGRTHTASDAYADGSIEIMERFVVRPGEYEVVEKGSFYR